jgi:hypothetical protein
MAEKLMSDLFGSDDDDSSEEEPSKPQAVKEEAAEVRDISRGAGVVWCGVVWVAVM